MAAHHTDQRSPGELPEVIARYHHAHDRRDTEVALGTFAPGATVVDDGHRYRGRDEIRGWLATAGAEFTFERTLLEATSTAPDRWLVVNHLEGDFPGGTVDLRYEFTLDDGEGAITELLIAP